MDIQGLFRGLTQNQYGILCSAGEAELSYPEDGNALCFGLEDRSFWFRHRNEIIAETIKRYPPSCHPILDIGGGNGFVTRRLLDEGFQTVLIEPGRVGAWNAKVRREIPWVVCSTLEESGLPDESVGAVGCFDVLEHIEKDREFLQNVMRVLKPGGLLYLAVPARRWLWSHMDIVAGHYRRYDHRTLTSLFQQDAEILYFTHFFGWLTLPLFLLKALPSRLGILKHENVFTYETEHGVDNSAISSILTFLLHGEVKMVRNGGSKKLGTSCLLVARKRECQKNGNASDHL